MANFGEYRAWKGWHEANFGRFDPIEANLFAAELKQSGIALGSKQNLLEIGFGNGHFAAWVVSQGWQYTGTEVDPDLIERGRTAGFKVFAADEELNSAQTFDIVIAFDVLEHLTLQEIVGLLQSSRRHLKSSGRFIARFPSGDSPFARAMQYGDITHRSVIGTGAVQQLSLKSGFKVLQTRAPALPIFGVGIKRALRRAALLTARTFINAIFRIVYFENGRRVIEPNMVIVLQPAPTESTSF